MMILSIQQDILYMILQWICKKSLHIKAALSASYMIASLWTVVFTT